MTRQQLVQQIRTNNLISVSGLIRILPKFPKHLLSEPDPVFAFNKQIIDATKEYCVGYKINTAFYEALGLPGWEAMAKTLTIFLLHILTLPMPNAAISVILLSICQSIF